MRRRAPWLRGRETPLFCQTMRVKRDTKKVTYCTCNRDGIMVVSTATNAGDETVGDLQIDRIQVPEPEAGTVHHHHR